MLSVRSNRMHDTLLMGRSFIDLLSVTPSNQTVEPTAIVNARRLYKSCVDEASIDAEGVDPVLSLIETEFGGWPILTGSSWDSSTFDFGELLLNLRKYNYNFYFRVGTATDEKNSSSYDIEVRLRRWMFFWSSSSNDCFVSGRTRWSWTRTEKLLCGWHTRQYCLSKVHARSGDGLGKWHHDGRAGRQRHVCLWKESSSGSSLSLSHSVFLLLSVHPIEMTLFSTIGPPPTNDNGRTRRFARRLAI